MNPTLMPGDVVLAEQLVGSAAPIPRLGELIVYNRDDGQGVLPFTGRVIGLPSDEVSFQNGSPLINGNRAWREEVGSGEWEGRRIRLSREEIGGRTFRVQHFEGDVEELPGLRTMPAISVPAAQMFVAGDFRDNSIDSRLVGPFALTAATHRIVRVLYGTDVGRIGQAVQ
ncbi:hypothetical protein U91I_03825 [alpha proteobacterium U9-1i]|nr:hypothetical protein U91I_03825 [alpha proteobacterium U9-1i]